MAEATIRFVADASTRTATVRTVAGEPNDGGDFILSRLPTWMPRDRSTGNYKLAHSIGRSLVEIDDEVEALDDATTVQNARTVDQLHELARLVDLPPQTDEPLEKYRTRVIAEFQTSTTEGTIPDLITNTATLLDVDESQILYERADEDGVSRLSIPGPALQDLPITDDEFTDIAGKHLAAGFRLIIHSRGTFTYITPEDYNGDAHDAARGYDGLDANGDPKNNGGTYAGFLQK